MVHVFAQETWASPFGMVKSMQSFRVLRSRLAAASLAAALIAVVPSPVRAESKDMIELKAQVAQLSDMLQRLQSTVDSRFGLLQHLVEQTADSSNRVAAAMETLQQKVAAQNEALGGKVDSTAGQMQSVNDSVDEVKARLAKLERSIQDLQTELQNAQQPQAAPTSGAPGGPGGMASNGGAPAANPAANSAPPLQETYQSGVRDFNSGKYQVAQSEFSDVIQYYPQDDMAGGAQFYLGEIAYKSQDYENAVKAYNAVLESFPSSSKAPAAQLHKAYALLAQNKRESGIAELRSLIRRKPNSPEAMQARSKLNGMGVKVTASVER